MLWSDLLIFFFKLGTWSCEVDTLFPIFSPLYFLSWDPGCSINIFWNTVLGNWAMFFTVRNDKTVTSSGTHPTNTESYRLYFGLTTSLGKCLALVLLKTEPWAFQHSCISHWATGGQCASARDNDKTPSRSLYELAFFRTCCLILEDYLKEYLLVFLFWFHLESNENPLPVPNIRWTTERQLSLGTQTCKMMCPTSVCVHLRPSLYPSSHVETSICVK